MQRYPVRSYGAALAVVTVVQDRSAPLGLLASVRTATKGPVRTVVVDAGGDPGPVPDGVDVITVGEAVGRGTGVNRAIAGLDPAVGWVAVADPRVQWGAVALDALLDAATRHPRAGALGPTIRDDRGGVLPSAGPLPSVQAALRGRIPATTTPGIVGWLSASCLLLRRSAWDSVDGFDPRYVAPPARTADWAAGDWAAGDWADVDLGDRLGRAGWLCVHVPAAEVTVAGLLGPGISDMPGSGARSADAAHGGRRYLRDRHRGSARAALALARLALHHRGGP